MDDPFPFAVNVTQPHAQIVAFGLLMIRAGAPWMVIVIEACGLVQPFNTKAIFAV